MFIQTGVNFIEDINEIDKSEIIYEFEKNNLILDNFIYQIKRDGILIKGRISRKVVEFYPWEVFEFYTFNFKNKNNSLSFRLKQEFTLQAYKSPDINWILFSFKKSGKQKILNFLNEKLYEKEYIKEPKPKFKIIIIFILIILFILLKSLNFGLSLILIPVIFAMIFIILSQNKNYK